MVLRAVRRPTLRPTTGAEIHDILDDRCINPAPNCFIPISNAMAAVSAMCAAFVNLSESGHAAGQGLLLRRRPYPLRTKHHNTPNIHVLRCAPLPWRLPSTARLCCLRSPRRAAPAENCAPACGTQAYKRSQSLPGRALSYGRTDAVVPNRVATRARSRSLTESSSLVTNGRLGKLLLPSMLLQASEPHAPRLQLHAGKC